jgi:Bacterial membrane protein YfhO
MNALTNSRALLDRINTPRRHAFFVILFYSLLFLTFFSPVVFGGRILAIGGDGLYIHLPNFYSSKVLWDTMTFGGFPLMADPVAATWYPPAALLSLLPGTWNVFVILAYVAGSSFMYGYLFKITESRMAALISGIGFGLSGFMMAQAGNAVIIHSTVWVPLIIWSLEQLRARLSTLWLAAGSIGVALCLLGGHPQIFFYAAILSAAYAIVRGWSAPLGRWRYYAVSFLMLGLGTGLAAVQIVPTSELLSQSLRAGYSFQDFVSYSLPPRQALTMIFPNVFGGLSESGLLPYFGHDNQTELTGYVGLLSLFLAALGLIATKKKSLGLFWLCVALLAFLLVLGDSTPLARLVYHLPILSSFRVPSRHFMEFTFATSVLAGLGVAAIVKRQVSTVLIRKITLVATMALLACLIFLFLNQNYMAARAAENGISQLSLLPWANRAVGVPLLIFLMAIVAIFYWHRRPTSTLRSALLLLVLVVDLGSFGFFYQWRYFSLSKSALIAPPFAERYKDSLKASNQRLMSFRGYRGAADEMPAGLTRLWGVPNASGYNALILKRTSNLLPMIDQPGLPLPWSEPENRSLDLMAVRYLFMPANELTTDSRGVSWRADDMQLWLGQTCNQLTRKSATVVVPAPTKSTALAIVSRLACSAQIPDGTEVARIRLTDAAGAVQTRSLLAGRDSSEWAYDCGSVKPSMRHQRARIFSSYPAKMNDELCQGHLYATTLPLDGVKEIKSIEFEWVGGAGTIILEKLSLIDEASKTSHPIDPAFIDSDAWRLVEEAGAARVYENLRVMPRAWLANEVVSVSPNQALDAIKTGNLPDGRGFDPARTALVEAPIALNSQNVDSKSSAIVTALSGTHMEVHTSSSEAGFLITSDAYYPGWRASVDGQEAPLCRADYAIRGVMLPPGQHNVSFDYNPRRFYLGAGISVLSLLALGALAWTGLAHRSIKAF